MKRKRKNGRDERAGKRPKLETGSNGQPAWPLLRCYYPEVLTLRQYLASKLSKSKKRQRRLLHYGLDSKLHFKGPSDPDVVKLLDTIVVGTTDNTEGDANAAATLDKDVSLFTQQLSESTATISPTQGTFKQSEVRFTIRKLFDFATKHDLQYHVPLTNLEQIVDFTIWLIFRRHHGLHRPSHLLSHGFQRYAGGPDYGSDLVIVPGVPGIWSSCSNPHVQTLKSQPWSALPLLLGKGADGILSDMLLRCGVYQPVAESGNLSQLSGVPTCDLKPLRFEQPKTSQPSSEATTDGLRGIGELASNKQRGLSDIRFVRHRMLYAKPTLNGKGDIRFGLGRLHALNQRLEVDDEAQTVHMMKYIFPRQFGLHNVFTSEKDPYDTAQPFKDYTLREQEISRENYRWKQRLSNTSETELGAQRPLPKRLRGHAVELVRRVRKRHSRCAYKSLLEYYCPRPSKTNSERSIDQASSAAQVSAFCRAVVSRVFPTDFWGGVEVGACNRSKILHMVDRFVRLGRYETLSLHDILQDIKIKGVRWVAPAAVEPCSLISETDFKKRKEIMAELLYYLFDSFVVPLIRGHFYVTESSAHRNQLFYFRQDVWKAISEPALHALKSSMLEPCDNTAAAKRTIAKRELGVSHVRLLPKERGMRPIINLRRRVQQVQRGRLVLGRSINSILTPAFSILNFEKARQPGLLGAALFSAEDMFPRLQAFRAALVRDGVFGRPLFFAKVDVKACFDTIPQKRLLQLAKSIVGSDVYYIARYARAKLMGGQHKGSPQFGARPLWRFLTKAVAGQSEYDFTGAIEADTAEGRNRSVYVDGLPQKAEHRKAILDLLEEHVESNMITLGNRLYRQKQGIPQGSIISSLLCSYFYAELERKVLDFVNEHGHSILLRLIDDFLVISTEQRVAERFMRIMHEGVPEFGIEVKAEKSRTNFDLEIDGIVVASLPAATDFPYCGSAINTVTLDLSKDRGRRKGNDGRDSVTIEYSKVPGQSFYRKILNLLKLQMQAMLLSTSYNSLPTVLTNLQHSFTEVAQKTLHYIGALAGAKQPSGKLVIRAVDDLIKLACALVRRRKRSGKDVLPYECCVSAAQIRWLACTAFRDVFRQRQTGHKVLLNWLAGQLTLPNVRSHRRNLTAAVANGV